MRIVRVAAFAVLALAGALCVWRGFGPIPDNPIWFAFLLFAVVNAAGVIALSRRHDGACGLKIAALALVLEGVIAFLALIGFDLWFHLVVPPPPPAEWHDSLPGLGKMIVGVTVSSALAVGGLALGWGLWVIALRRAGAPE
ncbi:MAG: hypothetical protein V4574_21530 [Pseudomonadota bacterium]